MELLGCVLMMIFTICAGGYMLYQDGYRRGRQENPMRIEIIRYEQKNDIPKRRR